MLHLIHDCRKYGRNSRFHHCFGDEDGMKWLKRNLGLSVLLRRFFRCKFLLGGFVHHRFGNL